MDERRAIDPDRAAPPASTGDQSGPNPRAVDPAALPLPYLSRRRLAQVAGLVIAAWLVIAFGRQVAQASAASDRAAELRANNAALLQQVTALQSDLARVQDPRFIELEGRSVGLGGPGEIPFTL